MTNYWPKQKESIILFTGALSKQNSPTYIISKKMEQKSSPPQASYANELEAKEGGFTCRRPLP